MTSPRDRRSLRRQIAEDDDAIEIDIGEHKDHGIGITTFLNKDKDQPGPGFSTRIPVAQPQIPRVTKGVGFEGVSAPSDSEPEDGTSARTVASEGQEVEDLTVPSARTVTAEVLTTPTRATHDELSIGVTPSTPEEQRQFDDDNCPATRAEFRKMKEQLQEHRLAVNLLIQRRQECDEFIGMKTLLRVAQRSNQTTRDQVERQTLKTMTKCSRGMTGLWQWKSATLS